MGAWGSGHFENDDASDWCYDLTDAASERAAKDVIESALRTAADLPIDEYLDADSGSPMAWRRGSDPIPVSP